MDFKQDRLGNALRDLVNQDQIGQKKLVQLGNMFRGMGIIQDDLGTGCAEWEYSRTTWEQAARLGN